MKEPEIVASSLRTFGQWSELIAVLKPYQLQLKLAALLITSIIAFAIGRLAQNNELERSLDKLNNAEYFKNELNKDLALTKKRLVSVKKGIRVTVVAAVLSLMVLLASMSRIAGEYLSAWYLLYLLIAVGVVGLLLVAYKRFLVNREKKQTLKLGNIYTEEDKEVDKVLKAIGGKLADRLKTRLEAIERETFQKNRKKECDLYKCKETKRTLKQAEQFFQKTVSELTTHKWCARCAEQQSAEAPFLKVDLSSVKTDGLELEDLKRLFNKLLEIYNEKKKELDRSCTEQCAKSFCENLRSLSQRFYEKVAQCEKKLEGLKTGR